MKARSSETRAVQKRRERSDSFTAQRQAKFLEAFASNCNVQMSCDIVGVHPTTVYRRRQSDPYFRLGWAQAEDNGIAVLRAELVRRGLEFVRAVGPDAEQTAALAGMDARLLLTLIKQHETSIQKPVGDVSPGRSDVKFAVQRLEKLLIRLKSERAARRERARAIKALASQQPPTPE